VVRGEESIQRLIDKILRAAFHQTIMKPLNKYPLATSMLLTIAPFLLLAGLFLLSEAWEFMTLPQAKEIERRVKTDLPKGTENAKVLAFLDAYEFHRSDFRKADAFAKRTSNYEHEKVKPLINLIEYQVLGWRYIASWGFWKTRIHLHFYFDSEGKLIEYTTRQTMESL
jgi:hypothetical protein